MNINQELYETYLEILAKLADCGGTKAMIAGGAVRDMLLDKPIKDIDIFYEGELSNKKVREHFFFKKEKPALTKQEISGGWLNNFANGLFDEVVDNKYDDDGSGTWQVTHGEVWYKECPYPIQLIKIDDLTNRMDTFSVGISKVAVLPDGVLWMTKDFITDSTTKTLHIDPNCEEKYTKKIMEKYSEYEAVEACLMY